MLVKENFMQVTNNNTSSLRFSGAFRIKPREIKAKAEIPQLFTQRKQVFNDILEKGDEVIVLKDSRNYDKRVLEYAKENNVSGLEYYPDITTKSGLDTEQPEGLLALIKNKAKVVKGNLEEITNAILEKKRPTRKTKIDKVNNEITKISDTLRLNIEEPKIVVSNKSFTRIRDGHKMRTIEVIAPNSATSYVHVIPDSLNEQSVKCILNGKGQIVKTFDTPNEIHKFNLLFNKLKKENINILVNK